MNVIGLALALASSAPSDARSVRFDTTVAGDDTAPLVVLCDPVRFRFSVRAVADRRTLDRSYPRRTVIAPETLVVMLPALTGSNDIRGPLTRYVRCGPFTVKLDGDAYNANVQGEAGAYPAFAAVSIIVGNQTVTGPIRLTECDRRLPRAVNCPAGYAVRIDGAYDAARHTLTLLQTTSSTADDDPATRRVTTSRTSTDLDLTAWPVSTDD